LNDAQWQVLEPLVPAVKKVGRLAKYERREILNVLLCSTKNGTWQNIHDRLREQVRQKQGRDPHPSAAFLDSQSGLDSQSVKTTEKGKTTEGGSPWLRWRQKDQSAQA